MTMEPKVLFFKSPDDFRAWLQQHHMTATEQWVGFYKKHTKLPSITWPESVDQALCFGWIDGLRKTIDDQAYKIRFTPRKPQSHWSRVNITRMKELRKLGMVEKSGLEAFKKRNPNRSKLAAYEQTGVIELTAEYQSEFENSTKAWQDFVKRPPSYRRQCIWWVMSAKREETQKRRLGILIESCKLGQKVPPLRWQK